MKTDLQNFKIIGTYRVVYLTNKYVIKLPYYKNFFSGLKANRSENKNQYRSDSLCPTFSFLWGFINIQPRCKSFLEKDVLLCELIKLVEDNKLQDIVELKFSSFGYLNKELVAFDYHD